ncbi:MAG TPA: twin-arginine translocase subunit TatC, partial [Algoriphagus sp.]|nr:twin-arginine translocase subunit TatC [Algoriphagus sp.]
MALDQYQEEEEGMSFLDHLEALRWHLLRSVAAILIF